MLLLASDGSVRGDGSPQGEAVAAWLTSHRDYWLAGLLLADLEAVRSGAAPNYQREDLGWEVSGEAVRLYQRGDPWGDPEAPSPPAAVAVVPLETLREALLHYLPLLTLTAQRADGRVRPPEVRELVLLSKLHYAELDFETALHQAHKEEGEHGPFVRLSGSLLALEAARSNYLLADIDRVNLARWVMTHLARKPAGSAPLRCMSGSELLEVLDLLFELLLGLDPNADPYLWLACQDVLNALPREAVGEAMLAWLPQWLAKEGERVAGFPGDGDEVALPGGVYDLDVLYLPAFGGVRDQLRELVRAAFGDRAVAVMDSEEGRFR